MSIAPIDYSAFQRNPVGIEAVLARGGSALSSILRDAMQVGRDRANRQASQEKDFLAERGRIDNLNQRRGEVALNAMQEDRRFGEGVRQFDTRMSEDARQFETTSARADEALGLQRQAAERDKLRLDSQIESDKFNRESLRPKELELRDKDIEARKLDIEATRESTRAKSDEAAFRRSQFERSTIDRDTTTAMTEAYARALKEGRNEDAQNIVRTLRDPRYGMDESALESMSLETGLPVARSSRSRASEADDITTWDLPTLEEEIEILETAVEETSSGMPSTTVAERLERLRLERRKRLDKPGGTGTSRAPAGTLQSLLEKGTGAY
jgi:hypothetical protein